MFTHGLADVEDTEIEENTFAGDNGDALGNIDINNTPETPPQTPITPTTNSWTSSAGSNNSTTVFANMFVHVRMFERTLYTVFGILLMLLVGTCVAFSATNEAVTNLFVSILRGTRFVSNLEEMGIEGVGWMIGRTVGRFAKGFVRGYIMCCGIETMEVNAGTCMEGKLRCGTLMSCKYRLYMDQI
jgi:hypothetical protein